MIHRRTPAVLAVLAAGALAVPGAALAKGGGTPAPEPTSYVQCDYTLDGLLPDGSAYVFSNQVNTAGCIRVASSTTSSSLRLYSIQLTPGWSSVVRKNGEGTDSTVLVDFSNAATGQTVTARIEFGRTKIG